MVEQFTGVGNVSFEVSDTGIGIPAENEIRFSKLCQPTAQ